MAKHYQWRGNNFDFSDSTPTDCTHLDPKIRDSAYKTLCAIVNAGYKGVELVSSTEETTGRPVTYVLYDPSTIEGIAAGAILESLPTSPEPYKPDELLMLIAGSYMIKALCPPEVFDVERDAQ